MDEKQFPSSGYVRVRVWDAMFNRHVQSPCSMGGRKRGIDRFALFSQGIEWVGQLDQLAYKIRLQETAGEVKVSIRS